MSPFIPSGGHFSDFILVRGWGGDRPECATQDLQVLFFSGVAYLQGKLIRSQSALQEALVAGDWLDALADATGSFTAVVSEGGSLFLLNDLFGMDQLFYYQSERALIVSNRVAAVLLVMRKLRVARKPYIASIAACLSSRHTFFQSAFTEQTFVEGVKLLPADSILEVRARHARLRAKPVFKALAKLEGPATHAYREHVREASRAVLDKVRVVAEDESFRGRILDVSGGKDSRVVFAAAIASGTLQRFDLTTHKTTDPSDFEVGLGLSQAYGGRLYAGDERPTYWKRSDFGLSVWRSMKCGLHHRISFANWLSLGQNRGSLHVNGASGEVYRDFWSSLFMRELKVDLAGGHTLDDLFRALTKSSAMPKPYLREAAACFSNSIASLPGRSMFEKLSNHYLFYRNRHHFGITAYNDYNRYLDWAPLQSASALIASRALDVEERASGRMLFDMIDHLFPALNAAPFATCYKWPKEFWARSSHCGVLDQGFTQTLAIDEAAWEASREAQSYDRLPNARHIDAADDRRSLDDLVADAAAECVAALLECGGDLARIVEPVARKDLAADAPGGMPKRLETASKIMAVYDQVVSEDARVLLTSRLPLEEIYDERGFGEITLLGDERADGVLNAAA